MNAINLLTKVVQKMMASTGSVLNKIRTTTVDGGSNLPQIVNYTVLSNKIKRLKNNRKKRATPSTSATSTQKYYFFPNNPLLEKPSPTVIKIDNASTNQPIGVHIMLDIFSKTNPPFSVNN